jgi:2-polyprenyl-3-methyl-5-hydroxy-6-metoxy-1,4-benzoquinol methylase
MNLFLSERNNDLEELMDDPACDPEALNRTYRRFSEVNRQLSQWGRLYRQYLRPLLNEHPKLHILDLGCGGGDVVRLIHRLAVQDGFQPKLTGADPDDRAIAFAQQHDAPDSFTFLKKSSTQLIQSGAAFDVVISNHVLHHLDPKQLRSFARDANVLSRKMVLFNDIYRNDWAYALFQIYTFGRFRNSFIRTDGLRSIRRSYTASELAQHLGPEWQTHALFPFRLIAIRHQSQTAAQ